ncbi:hypothetical protein MNBD_NITROSPINAE04-1962 [hydrothermal vent metagenome]|uniref:Uncharacterized protein n=1 Tax=hydrothermal vent metagenome TaxID=652676 RepID=A0A3B1BXE6_9ZZZZ
MVTPRTINVGPLYKPDGATPLANATITFTLVDARGKNTAGYEQATNAQVAGVISAVTDTNGQASVSLTPNDQLVGTTYYNVSPADAYGYTRFRAYLSTGSGSINFADLYVSSQNIAPGEWSAFSVHAQDETKHLTSNEDAALAAANSPSAGNPIATIADTAGGAFTNLTDTPASYTGQGGKYPKVKATEDGLEFDTATGGGETNTVSNVGAFGVGLFKQKTGVNLEFKNINAGSNKVSVTDDTANNEVDIDITEANIVHDNISGAGSNTHGQIDTHIDAASPHSGHENTVNKNSASGYAGLDGSSKLSGSQQVYGAIANTACEGDDARLSDARTPIAHNHSASDVNAGTLLHERGGLEADVSAYSGVPLINGGATSNLKYNFSATIAPVATDDSGAGYSVGSLWIDTTDDRIYICLDNTATAALWRELGVKDYKIDDFYTFSVNTHNPSTGAATDADSAPTYRVYEDETATPILTGSMALLDSTNTTGFYSEQIQLTAANGFEEGKSYNIYITATVGGTAGTTKRFFKM